MPILDLKTHPQHPDLAGFHQLVDVNQHRRWAFLFIVIGMNSNSCVTPWKSGSPKPCKPTSATATSSSHLHLIQSWREPTD